MKIIKKCGKNETTKNIFPTELRCDDCESILEVEEKDMSIEEGGEYTVICPVCGNKIYSGPFEEIDIDTLKYPQHYYDFSGGVDITDTAINNDVKRLILYLEKHRDESYIYTATGNTYIAVYRNETEFDIYVSKYYRQATIGE